MAANSRFAVAVHAATTLAYRQARGAEYVSSEELAASVRTNPVVVRRISEKVEIDDDAIAFLARAELKPGSNAVVVGSSSDGVQVKSAQGEQTVPRKLASLIYAIPA